MVLLHSPLILFGPVVWLGHAFYLFFQTEAWNWDTINSKASHMAKPKVKEWGSSLLIMRLCQGHGCREGGRVEANNAAYHN